MSHLHIRKEGPSLEALVENPDPLPDNSSFRRERHRCWVEQGYAWRFDKDRNTKVKAPVIACTQGKCKYRTDRSITANMHYNAHSEGYLDQSGNWKVAKAAKNPMFRTNMMKRIKRLDRKFRWPDSLHDDPSSSATVQDQQRHTGLGNQSIDAFKDTSQQWQHHADHLTQSGAETSLHGDESTNAAPGVVYAQQGMRIGPGMDYSNGLHIGQSQTPVIDHHGYVQPEYSSASLQSSVLPPASSQYHHGNHDHHLLRQSPAWYDYPNDHYDSMSEFAAGFDHNAHNHHLLTQAAAGYDQFNQHQDHPQSGAAAVYNQFDRHQHYLLSQAAAVYNQFDQHLPLSGAAAVYNPFDQHQHHLLSQAAAGYNQFNQHQDHPQSGAAAVYNQSDQHQHHLLSRAAAVYNQFDQHPAHAQQHHFYHHLDPCDPSHTNVEYPYHQPVYADAVPSHIRGLHSQSSDALPAPSYPIGQQGPNDAASRSESSDWPHPHKTARTNPTHPHVPSQGSIGSHSQGLTNSTASREILPKPASQGQGVLHQDTVLADRTFHGPDRFT